MPTRRFDGTNRHSGRKYNAVLNPEGKNQRSYYVGDDPYIAFQWKIEIGGIIIAHFQELSGLTWDTEVVTFQEGGLNDQVHQLMGQTKLSNLVLKNGFSDSMAMWNWRQEVMSPARASARKSGSIIFLKGLNGEIARWDFERAWPCKWDGPSLTSSSSQLAIETLEIAYERLKRIK